MSAGTAVPGAVLPRCPHFGACGGCQSQSLAYEDQLRLKRSKLESLLAQADIRDVPAVQVHASEPWEYRNRIRLRVERFESALRFGYNRVGSVEFLPIDTCPIAAPILWQTAEALLAAARENADAGAWLSAAAQVELFCDDTAKRVQVTLLCPQRRAPKSDSFTRGAEAWAERASQIVGAGAGSFDPLTAQIGRALAGFGAPGMQYRVGDESYWITRGAFFQVNRFLIAELVRVVCEGRGGSLAWDLFAGVGLFSSVLARSFTQVTAVEASPISVSDLRANLKKRSPTSAAVEATTLEFLRRAMLDRERPELVVLDPPRAGAGEEACALLARLAARTMVYVSCDPATLARDLAVLQAHYALRELHMLDLFPQTLHVETVAMLERRDI